VLRERALDFDPLSEPARHAALERKARIDLLQLEIEGYRDELGQLAPRAEETGSRAKEVELEAANIAAEREIEALGAAARTRSVWLFRDNEDQWRHDRLAEYVARLTALSDPDPFRGRIRDVEQALSRVPLRRAASTTRGAWKKRSPPSRTQRMPALSGAARRAAARTGFARPRFALGAVGVRASSQR
jgi:hypothetical protein